MICRRGEVSSEEVGAIRVNSRSSRVEVTREVASRFEKAAGREDPKDPKVKIRPWKAQDH